ALLHHLPRRVICVENPAAGTACEKSCAELIQRGTKGLEKIVLHSQTPITGSLAGIASFGGRGGAKMDFAADYSPFAFVTSLRRASRSRMRRSLPSFRTIPSILRAVMARETASRFVLTRAARSDRCGAGERSACPFFPARGTAQRKSSE